MKQLKRITYVEDEPDIRAIAQIALETIGGFTLNVCESGQEAVDSVSSFCPDMILLDIMMPDMDGVQTYQRLREMPDMNDVPIVFLTAKAQTHEIENHKALGVAAVITKPFDPITLPDQVRSIWERTQSSGNQTMKDKLKVLIERHCITIRNHVGAIGHHLSRIVETSSHEREALVEAESLAHQLKGSSGSIGFPEVSNAATILNDYIKNLCASNEIITEEQQARVFALYGELKVIAEKISPESSTLSATTASSDALPDV